MTKTSPARTVQATWITMLALQAIGTIDVKHRLPAPKQFVAISALWGILSLMADTGMARFAARLSLLLLLTAAVLGPFGPRFLSWVRMITARFSIQPTTPGNTSAPASPISPGTGTGATGATGVTSNV